MYGFKDAKAKAKGITSLKLIEEIALKIKIFLKKLRKEINKRKRKIQTHKHTCTREREREREREIGEKKNTISYTLA